ncbi:MAG: T9SS type A sorting domain-containing protein [candidate division WOR-3 bacterium]|nr:T9SS type A sorting domain-containing protein [candidate division WOR-3 bacterium]MDH5683279.1 T9SS type A sorting domain-containing protein [candidate division WOR-3 bacterium]
MKIKLASILAGIVLVLTLNGQADTLKVLFIGNSYTYYNEMPLMLVNLAQSAGRPVITGQSTPGGYTLELHTQDPTTISMISEGIWHYVVLQEQSQIPTIEYWRYNSMYPAARHLDSLIISYSESTAFFMTWGRKYGGMQTYNGYSSPDFRDFFHMQETLSSAYTEIANELSATLCPVGNAWSLAKQIDSLVDLWQSDYSHPTLKGSYLTACVFYCVFFDSSPVGLPYTGGLSQEDALFCQNVAWQTVSGIDDEPVHNLPSKVQLQIYPNPFSRTVFIKSNFSKSENSKLKIYDIKGRLIKQFNLSDAVSVLWDGTNQQGKKVPYGIYFCRLSSTKYNISRKVTFAR